MWIDPHRPFLFHLDIQLIDTCNLNCNGCTHFCGLTDEPNEVSLADFENQLQRLSGLQIANIALLGGEPLLINNIQEYCGVARRYYPDANIYLFTNGLLLDKQPPAFWQSLRQNNIMIRLSLYKHMAQKEQYFRNLFTRHKVMYHIEARNYFLHNLKRTGLSDARVSTKNCCMDDCRILYHGRIWHCPLDAMHHLYEKAFNKTFPKGKSQSIEDFVNDTSYMAEPTEFCKYCAERPKNYPWTCRKEHKESDWIA